MKRRLFTIISALSLLLFVAVVGLWVRSYWVADVVNWIGDPLAIFVVSSGGEICILVGELVPSAIGKWPRGLTWRQMIPDDRIWGVDPPEIDTGLFGLRYIAGYQGGVYDRLLLIPYPFVAVPAVALSALICHRWMRTRQRERTVSRNLCPSCGYDLRATPGRCPECGLVPAALPPTTPTSRRNDR